MTQTAELCQAKIINPPVDRAPKEQRGGRTIFWPSQPIDNADEQNDKHRQTVAVVKMLHGEKLVRITQYGMKKRLR